jgi:DNA-binding beta-propeller fold protein YncE
MRLKVLVLVLLLALALPVMAQDGAPEASGALELRLLGTYASGVYLEGGAEIVAHHPGTQTLYVTNGSTGTLDLIDVNDPTIPTLITQIDLSAFGGAGTSVNVYGDMVAVAVNADTVGERGMVAFFDPAGEPLGTVEVGFLPDMVTFTPDGTKVLTANEGEPNADYSIDPEGSVSIIDVSGGVENATVTEVGFTDFNADGARAAELPADVRIFGPNATVAQDLEPEYIAVSADSSTAYVVLQENNALAVIDIASGSVTGIVALGFKDHSVEGNGIDASDEDGAINITTWPVFGIYHPDGIALFEANGTSYLVTANEGDTRDYETYSEEARLADLTLDAEAFPNAEELQAAENLGRLTVTTSMGDTDGDGEFEAIYVPGARSFSIWSADGALVYDSGDQFEQITAAAYPDNFNSNHEENDSFDNRSDNKGPEPEGVAIGEIDGRVYAFIGLERMSGVMVYDVTDPTAPAFVTYSNNRDFSGNAEAGTAGDLGPEGLIFISAENSPTGTPLLVMAHEVSGTTSIFEIAAGM